MEDDPGAPGGVGIPGGKDGRGGGTPSIDAPARMVDAVEEWFMFVLWLLSWFGLDEDTVDPAVVWTVVGKDTSILLTG